MPGGIVHGTENGCFAKTFSLDPDFEPNIYRAVTKPNAYLENVYQDEHGKVNFFETSYTKNGRAVFGLADLGRFKDAQELGKVDYILILNWNENIIPAVARLNQVQAAAYFMLGETTGTSAGGAAEEGKFLRVPGTNPFFPLRQGQQGMRFHELLDTHPTEVHLMNTGRIGGKPDHDGSIKVKIPHSSAIVKAIAEQTIKWDQDPDFGYEIATEVPGVDDIEMLQPRRLYERQGRLDEYEAMVARLKRERAETLATYPDLLEEIVRAIA
jgi:phosphoenolpyruvate carboxykinase (ATP)